VSSGLGASCNLPIAAFAELHEGGFRLSAFISDLQGEIRLQVLRQGPMEQSAHIAAEVTRELISQGAGELIKGN
jgi:hydroxymethylbilane synthase